MEATFLEWVKVDLSLAPCKPKICRQFYDRLDSHGKSGEGGGVWLFVKPKLANFANFAKDSYK